MNRNNTLVSTVIASYNMGKYLPEAVESVRAQTYSPIEIIIVDDGSTDETAVLVEQWKSDPRIRYVWQSNQGQTKAKNRGIAEASGTHIAFLDADDRWKPTKLERQMPLFDGSQNIGVVYSDAIFINEAGREVGRRNNAHPQGRVTKELLDDNFVYFGSSVVARYAIERCGFFDEALAMSIDYDLWLRMSTVYEFGYIDEPLLEYRIWAGQMSHKMIQRTDCVLRILDKFESEHADLVGTRVLARARASTYVSRAYAHLEAGEGRFAAIHDMLRALRFDAGYLKAWKGLARLILGLRRPV